MTLLETQLRTEARIKLKHLYPEIVEPSNDPNSS
jgi:hypothetical protein